MLLAKGTVLNKKWEIGELVGEGACGRVYAVKGTNGLSTSFPLVAKVIPTSLGIGVTAKAASEQKRLCDTLNYEYTLFIGNLCEFSYRPDIPDIRTFHGVDVDHGVRFMVMERFERDLVGYAVNSNPDNRSVANIGLQILEGLQWMHAKCLLFIDVKPDNFMLNGDILKFVDFGLVERWASSVGPGSRDQVTRKMAGTPTYASLDVHNSCTPMRKDDIESMGLVLISLFLKGQMPWSDSKSDKECRERKSACDITALSADNNCPEVGEIIHLCRALQNDQKPDYDRYKTLLLKMRDRKSMAGKLVEKTGASSSSSNSIAQKNIEIPKNVKNVKNITKDRIVTPRMVVDDIGYIENELSNTLSQSKLMDSKRLTSTPKKNLNISSVEESPRLQQPAKRSSRIAEQDAKANGRSPFSSPDPATIIGKRKSLSPVPFPVNGPPILCREQHLSFEVLSGKSVGRRIPLGTSLLLETNLQAQRIVGRDGGTADITLGGDKLISDRHFCAIWCWDSVNQLELNIQDRQSTNGTVLNGSKLVPGKWTRAYSGDVISLGGSKLKISCISTK